jgi:hypothetical protein
MTMNTKTSKLPIKSIGFTQPKKSDKMVSLYNMARTFFQGHTVIPPGGS